MLGFYIGCAVAGLVVLGLVGYLVRREVRVLRAAKHDRPAVLEGGGSHLSGDRRR